MEQTVAAGVAQGVAGSPIPHGWATFALFGMCNWAYQWYRPGGPLGHREVADELFRVYLHGISA